MAAPPDRIAVLIPAYRETGRIGALVGRVRALLPGLGVVVVDDGSADGTAAEAGRAGATVLRHPFNLGDGAARQTGYRYAVAHGYQTVVQMDGDGQHDPASIPGLLAAVADGADIALGSRFLGGEPYAVPPIRRIGMRLFSRLATWLTGERITDPTSGFQALSHRAVRFYAGEVYPVFYPDADVLIMAHRAGLRIVEVPVLMHPSPGKLGLHRGLWPLYYVAKMGLSIAVTVLRTETIQKEEEG